MPKKKFLQIITSSFIGIACSLNLNGLKAMEYIRNEGEPFCLRGKQYGPSGYLTPVLTGSRKMRVPNSRNIVHDTF